MMEKDLETFTKNNYFFLSVHNQLATALKSLAHLAILHIN